MSSPGTPGSGRCGRCLRRASSSQENVVDGESVPSSSVPKGGLAELQKFNASLKRDLEAQMDGGPAKVAPLQELDRVIFLRERDPATPKGSYGVVQQKLEGEKVLVEWVNGRRREHRSEELVRRREICSQGHVVAGRHGDSGTFCVVSFPGVEADAWDDLVHSAEKGHFSTACVFLSKGDPRHGEHRPDPENPGNCYCATLYGRQRAWGCRWFADWENHVIEAHRRGQKLVVVYGREHLQRYEADWSCSLSMPDLPGELSWDALAQAGRTGSLWDADAGLGGSQLCEVAWLKRQGIPFYRVDVADGAPDSARAVARLLRRGVTLCERVEGAGDTDGEKMEAVKRMQELSCIQKLLYDVGEHAAAEPLARRALAASDKALGGDHAWTLCALNFLALTMEENGRLESAGPIYQRAVEVSERTRGPDHADTLGLVVNLAGLLEKMGHFEAAEPLYRRALESSERTLGRDHPDTLLSVGCLAHLLEKRGLLEDAEPLHRRALAAHEQALGPEHPETLVSVNNLAGLLEEKGDLDSAEPLYRQALAASGRVLGVDHPDTLVSLNNLAGLLVHKGELEDAEVLYRRALEGRERALGREHASTLLSVNNLAYLLQKRGRLDDAEQLYLRALESSENSLGLSHPSTFSSLNNLALLLSAKGQPQAAEKLLRRAAEGTERSLGQQHPDTQLYAQNLAAVLRAQRR